MHDGSLPADSCPDACMANNLLPVMQVGVIEAHIRTVGLAPTKARNLKAMSQVRAWTLLECPGICWAA